MSIEEADPIRLIMAKSNAKSTAKSKRSRGISMSNYIITEDDAPGNGLDDRLSPKFEKMMLLETKPSHQEHSKKTQKNNLMLRTINPATGGGILSPPLPSNPTTKSFLSKIAT